MAQFDLYRLRSGMLVVGLQSDLIGIKASRIASRRCARPGVMRPFPA